MVFSLRLVIFLSLNLVWRCLFPKCLFRQYSVHTLFGGVGLGGGMGGIHNTVNLGMSTGIGGNGALSFICI